MFEGLWVPMFKAKTDNWIEFLPLQELCCILLTCSCHFTPQVFDQVEPAPRQLRQLELVQVGIGDDQG